MDLQLTPEIHEALSAQPGRPLRVEDPLTQTGYFLVPEATYRRIEPLIYDDREFDVAEFMPLAQEAFREDWDAPGMDLYDNYDAHRRQP